MRPDDLKAWLQRAPFESFTLELSNGEQYTVRHPEELWVGRSSCHLGMFDQERLLEQMVHIALVHIVKIEPASQTNGRRKRRA